MRSIYTTALIAMLSTETVFAFPDKYEADNSAEEAREVIVDALHREGEQHTLHKNSDDSLDEDWFKFYAPKDADYDIEIKGVGSDLQIGLELYAADQVDEPFDGDNGSEGSDISLRFQSETAGYYYLRVIDVAKLSEDCRANMQYTLSMTDRAAGTVEVVQIEGWVRDALSGRELNNAIVNLNCKPFEQFCCPPTGFCPETEETIIGGESVRRKSIPCAPTNSDEGSYTLSISSTSGEEGVDSCRKELNDPVEIAVWREGYRPITCRFYIPNPAMSEKDVKIFEDISLFPEDEKMFNPVPMQANGKLQLAVNFPQGCVDYYIGMLQPDGAFFVLPERNNLQPFSEGSLKLLNWRNAGNTALDLPVVDLPRGEYQFYLLRTAKGADPMKHLDEYPDDLGMTIYQLK